MGINHLKLKESSFHPFYFQNASLTNVKRIKFTSKYDYFTYPINIDLGLQLHVNYSKQYTGKIEVFFSLKKKNNIVKKDHIFCFWKGRMNLILIGVCGSHSNEY